MRQGNPATKVSFSKVWAITDAGSVTLNCAETCLAMVVGEGARRDKLFDALDDFTLVERAKVVPIQECVITQIQRTKGSQSERSCQTASPTEPFFVSAET